MEKTIKVAEMFAGVGGFRIALDGYTSAINPELNSEPAGPFQTIWANQWEPPGTQSKQFAWDCYEKRFGENSCINKDINEVLNDYENGKIEIPDFDFLVGGFPCQDYSVAKPLSRSRGIEGKKGVLWWDIFRMLKLKQPKLVLLENVDRLLKSPTKQRGRDFAIILSCMASLDYAVEWRVINAADYGMPQKRRRVFIFATHKGKIKSPESLRKEGVLSKAFPFDDINSKINSLKLDKDIYTVSSTFGLNQKVSPFHNSGAMINYDVVTTKVEARSSEHQHVLEEYLSPDSQVPESFFIPQEEEEKWKYQRAAKKEKRTTKTGFSYIYSEGSMPWPDPKNRPARTILTGEGGRSASRMKHAVVGDSGKIRRLIPDELDQLQMFPKGWTNTGMTDGQRAFCMGNALVVEIPHRIGKIIAKYQKDFLGEAL